jgi:hypothetical protein
MDPRIQIRIRIHPKMSWIRNTAEDCQNIPCEREGGRGLSLSISDVEVRQPAADGGGAAGAVHAGGPRPPRLPDTRQVPRLLLCDRHARLLQAQVPEAQRRLLLV